MISKIKTTGFKYSLQIFFNRVVPEKLFRCRRFTIFELASQPGPSPNDRSTEFRWTETEQDLLLTQELTGVQLEQPVGPVRVCLALDNQKIIGAIWCTPANFDERELGMRMVLAENHFWLYSAYVSNSHRRQGVYRHLMSFLTSHLISENPRARFWLAINPDNRRSMAAHRSFGIRPAARVFAARTGSRAFCRIRPRDSDTIGLVRKRTDNCWQKPLTIEIPKRITDQAD